MAAITAVNLTGNDQGSGASITTASISPSANKLVVVSVTNVFASGTPNTPTVSGDGFTWVLIGTQLSAANHQRTTLFRGMTASPSTGTLVIDFGGQTQDGSNWAVDQFTNMATTGTNGSDAVVQFAGNTSVGTLTTLAVTLGAFNNNNDATYGYVFINQAVLINPGASFTELQESGGSSGGEGESQFAATNQTNVPWTWSSTSLTATAMAIEIRSATSSSLLLGQEI